ncbi:hypothetical protein CLOLEP_00761 [[Clostridium] leptum DSM 753]|uniref:Uncharacterized protein n=1 Tax=[Clostridium] leptum DSM 753 TaxID=428125 RepID=A7VQD3_9FIRM|nr:hypothetical protein CLOLEP_00761 [[Clostridium] leptum DSM 753]
MHEKLPPRRICAAATTCRVETALYAVFGKIAAEPAAGYVFFAFDN